VEHLDSLMDIHIDTSWTESKDGLLECSETTTRHSYKETWSRPIAGSKVGSDVYIFAYIFDEYIFFLRVILLFTLSFMTNLRSAVHLGRCGWEC
jgi:hypothetical protein